MNTRASMGALAVLLASGTVSAQPQVYRLGASSKLTQRFCLGPCACPYHEYTGPMVGGFTLTLRDHGPLFDTYEVSSVNWSALINGLAVEVVGKGVYSIGGEVALVHRLVLDLVSPGEEPFHFDTGYIAMNPQHPFPQIADAVESNIIVCRQNVINIVSGPTGCYADCNYDGVTNLADFGCFQARFALQAPYADCNGDGAFNLADFGCFQTKFALGCP
jgi:hypothetical protein